MLKNWKIGKGEGEMKTGKRERRAKSQGQECLKTKMSFLAKSQNPGKLSVGNVPCAACSASAVPTCQALSWVPTPSVPGLRNTMAAPRNTMVSEPVSEGRTSQCSLTESIKVWGPDDTPLGWRQPQIPELSVSLLRGDTGIKSVPHT